MISVPHKFKVSATSTVREIVKGSVRPDLIVLNKLETNFGGVGDDRRSFSVGLNLEGSLVDPGLPGVSVDTIKHPGAGPTFINAGVVGSGSVV